MFRILHNLHLAQLEELQKLKGKYSKSNESKFINLITFLNNHLQVFIKIETKFLLALLF